MHVLIINGSSREHGSTYTALAEVAGELEKQDISTQIFPIGKKPIMGCTNCGGCMKSGYCVYADDGVNECIDLLKGADGLIVGSPVYYAGPNGALCAFLDRMFFLKHHNFYFKPGAAVANCRRGGASATLDRLNKYFTIANMPVVSSQYWNMTHGLSPADVKQDEEGLQTMRVLGRNMAWLLQCIENSRGVVPLPEEEKRLVTNFIR